MHHVRIFSAFAFAAVAILAAPTAGASQTTTDKIEQQGKSAAGSIAKGVQHVKAVKNDFEVVPVGDRKATDISDKDITRQIETRFSKTAQLAKIDVRTDGGVVTLAGTAPSIGASARASEVARDLSGVRAVKNELTYDEPKRDRSSSNESHAQVAAMQLALKDKGFDPGPAAKLGMKRQSP